MTDRDYESSLKLPAGWRLVDQSFLAKHHTTLEPSRVLAYFDGRSPSWEEALSDAIPRRPVVNDLITKLSKSREDKESRVTVLLGAGGEGKSTALLQTAGEFAADEASWKVIWRDRGGDIFKANALLRLPKLNTTWLIVSDDADQIVDGIYDSVAQRSDRRNDIQFLLSAQDVDWKAARASHWQRNWSHIRYEEIFMRGFRLGREQEDARRVVSAWEKVGALGRLTGTDIDEAARRLVEAAVSGAAEYRREGAFLGAMLDVRKGTDDLEAHVLDIINRLEDKKVFGNRHTLLTPFIYIAAMHAEEFFYLTMKVLAKALSQPGFQCSEHDLNREVIFLLDEETVASPGGRHLLTRHIKIARAAMKILSNRRYDRDYYFEELLRAANRLYSPETQNGHAQPRPEYVKWKFWPNDFYERGQKQILESAQEKDEGEARALRSRGEELIELGIRLARVAHEMTPKDPRFINMLGRMLRETDAKEESVQLFTNSPEEARWERSFYHEWAMSEWRRSNNWAVKAWLCGIALADEGLADNRHMESYDERQANAHDLEERVIVGLAALARSFYHLYENYGAARVFIEACGAASQLGGKLNQDKASEESKGDLSNYKELSERENIYKVDMVTAIEWLKNGLIEAGKIQPDKLPQWIKKPEKMSFNQLSRLLNEPEIKPEIKIVRLVKREHENKYKDEKSMSDETEPLVFDFKMDKPIKH